MWLLLLAGIDAASPRADVVSGKTDLHAVIDAGLLQGSTVTFPGGVSSNRAMVTLTLPF